MIYAVARQNALRLGSAYGLTAVMVLAGQLYPLMTAFAINGVLERDWRPILFLALWHLLMAALEVGAKMYDTRVFTRVYADMAGGFVARAHREGLAPAVVTSRAILSREYVDFLEKDVPGVLMGLIGLATAMIVLLSLDPFVGGICVLLLLPLSLVNFSLARRSFILNRGLNDLLEREVGLLTRGRSSTVRRHFFALSQWRVRLSDSEARAFGLMELSVIVLIAAALWRLAQGGAVAAGDVYAIFAYVWRFVLALDGVPETVQRLAKLKDLNRRFGSSIATADHVGLSS